MHLCMFHPRGQPMERGWVGRVDRDCVVHLAAQTLQAFFLGGGGAREHARYPLDEVELLVPVQYPPAVRVFASEREFVFANPAAVVGPGASVPAPPGTDRLAVRGRLAAVIGAGETVGGYSLLLEWNAPGLREPKDRDFGLVLGPVVVTPDGLPEAPELRLASGAQTSSGTVAFDVGEALHWAASGTMLRPGDLLVSPPACVLDGIDPGAAVVLGCAAVGDLHAVSAPPARGEPAAAEASVT